MPATKAAGAVSPSTPALSVHFASPAKPDTRAPAASTATALTIVSWPASGRRGETVTTMWSGVVAAAASEADGTRKARAARAARARRRTADMAGLLRGGGQERSYV